MVALKYKVEKKDSAVEPFDHKYRLQHETFLSDWKAASCFPDTLDLCPLWGIPELFHMSGVSIRVKPRKLSHYNPSSTHELKTRIYLCHHGWFQSSNVLQFYPSNANNIIIHYYFHCLTIHLGIEPRTVLL